MVEKKKTRKALIVAVIILSILVIVLIGYICYDKYLNNDNTNKQTKISKTIKEDNTKKKKETENNSINDEFDFEELSNTLHSSIQNESITTFLSKCEIKNPNTNEPPETEYTNIEVSNNTIDTIINKLKTAKSIDKNVTYSWFGCPPKSITYYISVNSNNQSQVQNQMIFSLNYANGDDILLVGYNQNGYAFHFNNNEEINNIIESLQ